MPLGTTSAMMMVGCITCAARLNAGQCRRCRRRRGRGISRCRQNHCRSRSAGRGIRSRTIVGCWHWHWQRGISIITAIEKRSPAETVERSGRAAHGAGSGLESSVIFQAVVEIGRGPRRIHSFDLYVVAMEQLPCRPRSSAGAVADVVI